MSIVRTALTALLIVSIPSVSGATPAWQQEGLDAPADLGPLVTDRPDATESPETVGKGRFQLEAGYTFASFEQADVHSLGELLLRIGVLHENFELRLGFNSFSVVRDGDFDAKGLQNFGIGVKFRLLSGGGVGHARPTVAVLVSTTLPTANEAIEARTARPDVRLALAWDFSDRVSFGTNLIWTSIKEDELAERHSALGLTLAMGYGLSDRWGAYFEYFGAFPTGEYDPENYLNGGVTYLISNDLQLDGRVGYGLNGRDDDFFVGFGTAVRW